MTVLVVRSAPLNEQRIQSGSWLGFPMSNRLGIVALNSLTCANFRATRRAFGNRFVFVCYPGSFLCGWEFLGSWYLCSFLASANFDLWIVFFSVLSEVVDVTGEQQLCPICCLSKFWQFHNVQGINAMACLAASIGAVVPSSAVSLTVGRIQTSVSGGSRASLQVPCIRSGRLLTSNVVEDFKEVNCAFVLVCLMFCAAPCVAFRTLAVSLRLIFQLQLTF